MTAAAALKWAQELLSSRGISTARLDALVLLEDSTKTDRAKLLSEPDQVIPAGPLSVFKRQVKQRSKQLPLAYIRGKSEFYGKEFIINPHVLEPRPESEAMIDELNALFIGTKDPQCLIDVGTGSGALAITAAYMHPQLQILATDNSQQCLDVAAKNAALFSVQIAFLKCDLLDGVPAGTWNKKTVIMANLPYVPDNWQLNPPAMREPKGAIFGGGDGLDIYRRLFAQLKHLPAKPRFVLTEALPPQHRELKLIAQNAGYAQLKINDFIQVFKLG